MARIKKFSPRTEATLRAGTDLANRTLESNTDIVQIPGFEADTISYSRNIHGVVFTDSRGNKVVIKVSADGLKQWNWLTRR